MYNDKSNEKRPVWLTATQSYVIVRMIETVTKALMPPPEILSDMIEIVKALEEASSLSEEKLGPKMEQIEPRPDFDWN